MSGVAQPEGTALALAQRVAGELGIPAPTTLEGTTNETARRLKACIDATGRHLRKQYTWPKLIREFEVTLPQDTPFFLPHDMQRWLTMRMWDRTNDEQVRTVTPDDWQRRLATGFETVLSPQVRARGFVRHARKDSGATDRGSFETLDFPFPYQILQAVEMYGLDSSTASLAFEYVSKSWLHPPIVVGGKSYQKGDIVSGVGGSFRTVAYELFEAQSNFVNGDGPYYLTVENLIGQGVYSLVSNWAIWGTYQPGGDGTTFYPYTYDYVRYDDDTVLLDEDAMTAGTKYRFREMQGLPYAEFKQEYQYAIEAVAGVISGAKVVRSTELEPVMENIKEGSWDL